jgi:hypothetical protein
MKDYRFQIFQDSATFCESCGKMPPNLRYRANEAKTFLTNQRYEKDPNRETFVARPGRGANGESSN